jgi:hypothetical protein
MLAASAVLGVLVVITILVWPNSIHVGDFPVIEQQLGDVRMSSTMPTKSAPLPSGSTVITGTDSQVTLRYADGSELWLGPDSKLRIDAGSGKYIALNSGHLRATVAPQPSGAPLVVRSPEASATVLGTVFELRVDDSTMLAVQHGQVELRRLADDQRVVVTAGHWADSTELSLRVTTVPATTHHFALAQLIAAVAADDDVHNGSVIRPYREVLAGASGGACIALPGERTAIAIPVPNTDGPWWLWVRYRDEDTPRIGLPSFVIELNGRELITVTAPGGSRRWLWARCPTPIPTDGGLRIRSTFAGELDTTSTTFPYRTVNRLDAVTFTMDPNFDPRVP